MKWLDQLKYKFSNKQTFSPSSTIGGFGLSNMLGMQRISNVIAWNYYKTISPIGRGVKLIAQEAQSIPVKILDIKTRECFDDVNNNVDISHVLEVLRKPNKKQSKSSFVFEGVVTAIVCGEVFLEVEGITKAQSIRFRNPKHMIPIGADEYPTSWQFINGTDQYTYKKTEYGYYERSDTLARLYHFNKFNPDNGSGNYRGLSDLSPVIYEIEQYMETHVYNTSTLKKGARPSGALIMEKVMNDDRKAFLKAQLEQFYSGGGNAGNVMLLDGSKDFKELSLNSKDMDFANLLTISKDSMYENLNIPASFYDNSASSFNNKFTDRMSLYDFAVIPNAKWLYENISFALFDWSKKTDKYRIVFDEEEIPALRDRFMSQLKDKAELGVLTPNEVRKELKLDDIDGGESIYQPMSYVPMGSTIDTTSNNKIKAFTNQLVAKGYSIEDIDKFVTNNKKYLA